MCLLFCLPILWWFSTSLFVFQCQWHTGLKCLFSWFEGLSAQSGFSSRLKEKGELSWWISLHLEFTLVPFCCLHVCVCVCGGVCMCVCACLLCWSQCNTFCSKLIISVCPVFECELTECVLLTICILCTCSIIFVSKCTHLYLKWLCCLILGAWNKDDYSLLVWEQ